MRLHVRGFWQDRRGVAGIEFALVAGALCVLLLNGIEIARYAYSVMQVQNAAQMGAQSVWSECDPMTSVPATLKCTRMNTVIGAAIRSTSLGDDITLEEASEAYYCVDGSNNLVPENGIPLGSKPEDCSAVVGAHAGPPGDYIKVEVTYTFAPLFLDMTVGRFLAGPITKATYMRLQ